VVAALFVALLCFGKVPPAREMCEALALTKAWAIVTAFIGAKDWLGILYADLASATLPMSSCFLGFKKIQRPFKNATTLASL
jgi:hypothetical protein